MGQYTMVRADRYKQLVCWMCREFHRMDGLTTLPPPRECLGHCPQSIVPKNAYEKICHKGQMDRDKIEAGKLALVAAGKNPDSVWGEGFNEGRKQSANPVTLERLEELKAICLRAANPNSGSVPFWELDVTRTEMDELVKENFLFTRVAYGSKTRYYIVKKYRV